MPKPAPGRRYGKWVLVERLDNGVRGGNADVWRGRDEEGNDAAIKLLRQMHPDKEPYRRFRREVETQRQLTAEAFPGVLPLLASDLPDAQGDRAWLATPVATPIRQALESGGGLERVVSAIGDVADTLARLAERGMAHRDVKPENIYYLSGEWLIGDFGLIQLDQPESEPLTAGADLIGPRWYLAPEMVNHPGRAAGPPADVYSLAKTMWVLATGQRYPVPQHLVEHPATTISAYVAHPKSGILDLLLEQATSFDPARRPTASALRDSLRAWLRQSGGAPKQDLSEVQQRLLRAAHRVDTATSRHEDLVRQHNAAQARLRKSLSQVAEVIASVGLPKPKITWYEPDHQRSLQGHRLANDVGYPDGHIGHGYMAIYMCQRIPVSSTRFFVAGMESGYIVRLDETASVITAGMGHAVCHAKGGYSLGQAPRFPRDYEIVASAPVWNRHARAQAPDISQVLAACDQLAEAFLAALPSALNAFAAWTEAAASNATGRSGRRRRS